MVIEPLRRRGGRGGRTVTKECGRQGTPGVHPRVSEVGMGLGGVKDVVACCCRSSRTAVSLTVLES